MLSEDVLFLPVSELWKRMRRGEFSPVELTERYLHRLERLGPKLGAAITVTRELALEQARQAEKDMSAGHWRGPLHGIPYGAKDLLSARGIPTTWGAPPYKDQVFDFDATVITKLREAGAILIAKLSMIELAGGGGYSNGKFDATYDADVTDNDDEEPGAILDFSEKQGGFHLGAGAEVGLTEALYVKLEYVYTDYGSRSYRLEDMAAGDPGLDASSDRHQVVAGIGLRF